jgi:hypothetical protein
VLRSAWEFAIWLSSRRARPVHDRDVARHLYRSQTRGMGLRLTDWARDRLRPRWLRVRHGPRGSDE